MTFYSVLNPPNAPKSGLYKWHRLYGSAKSVAIVFAAKKYNGITLVIADDNNQANQIKTEIGLFANNDFDILHFPDWEILPYDNISPHQDIISSRLKTLKQLQNIKKAIVIVSIQTLVQRLVPKSYFDAFALSFTTGQIIAFQDLVNYLQNLGYHRVQQVLEHGEYAVRGEIIDIFPMGQKLPLRLDFFDNEIENIKAFEPETQRSLQSFDKINLLPASEIPHSQSAIKIFKENWHLEFGTENVEHQQVYRNVTNGLLPAGIESYLPWFFTETDSLFDYLPDKIQSVCFSDLTDAIDNIHQDYTERFVYRNSLTDNTQLSPAKLILFEDEFNRHLHKTRQIIISSFETEKADKNRCNFASSTLPGLKFNHNAPEPMQTLVDIIKAGKRILFISESKGLHEVLKNMLMDRGFVTQDFSSFNRFIDSESRLGLMDGYIAQGFYLEDSAVYLIPDSALFEVQATQPARKLRPKIDQDKIISNLSELNPDDPVVHVDHGVGRYRGLKTLDIGAHNTEFLTLEYANTDILYVPVSSLDLVHRYIGADSDTAPLHRLGSGQWQKSQKKARQKAHDIAVELLEIYAKREAKSRMGINTPDEQYHLFCAEFPFEPTVDQEKSIDAIIADMQTNRPMDRLICGDVGFGKTEVAMRAAFLAVQNGRQVAILVPTTLLAQQHYTTLVDRFASWPFNIEVLSRFNKANQTAFDNIKTGKADIIVGTHKLLSKEIKFNNLGLLIIDEEHKFGVKQKDKFKALRAEIDILTLTATPIPRTLNLSISGIRDLSIIASAPENRVAIKTFVKPWDAETIRESIMREVRRGGQVYFVHNRVESINKVARDLESLLPNVSIGIAHGQMRESELEAIMKDFYGHKFNILLCTTIIENGIDIPTANTIIINNADRFGLAQLYQLRGRVGRSHHRAYAYLTVQDLNSISINAKKRLEAVEALEELGVGFSLALQDLEIRGAGELLGAGQSGQIHEIGLELYNEILHKAISDLKTGKLETEPVRKTRIEIDLGEPALIPDDYIPDINSRLIIYKRISNAADKTRLEDLQVELIDRFGLLPDEVKTLFAISELKLKLAKLNIIKLDADHEEINIEFDKVTDSTLNKIISLIQEQPQIYKLSGEKTLKIKRDMDFIGSRLEAINELKVTLSQ